MNNIRILILEDNPADALRIEAGLSSLNFEICGIASNLNQALSLFFREEPDIVIIDIMLEGKKEGIAFAQTIARARGGALPMIFLTGLADQATFEEAKGLHPHGYLLKPFNQLELHYAIELAIERVAQTNRSFAGLPGAAAMVNNDIFIKSGHTLLRVPIKTIEFIEVNGKYCHITSPQGKFAVELPLKEIMTRLGANRFVRIHRNYLINLEEIKQLNMLDDEIILNNGTRLPASRRYRSAFLEMIQPLK